MFEPEQISTWQNYRHSKGSVNELDEMIRDVFASDAMGRNNLSTHEVILNLKGFWNTSMILQAYEFALWFKRQGVILYVTWLVNIILYHQDFLLFQLPSLIISDFYYD